MALSETAATSPRANLRNMVVLLKCAHAARFSFTHRPSVAPLQNGVRENGILREDNFLNGCSDVRQITSGERQRADVADAPATFFFTLPWRGRVSARVLRGDDIHMVDKRRQRLRIDDRADDHRPAASANLDFLLR